MVAEGGDAGPVPALLVAVTENVYGVPLVKPDTAQVVAPVVEQVLDPGDDTTVYPVMVDPPSLVGGDHCTDTIPLLAEPLTLEGAPGTAMPEGRWSSKLGEPVPMFAITLGVVFAMRRSISPSTPRVGFASMSLAKAPATCGAAIEVPLAVAYDPSNHEDLILLPGAKRSTQTPQFEKLDLASCEVEEATLTADAALAGE